MGVSSDLAHHGGDEIALAGILEERAIRRGKEEANRRSREWLQRREQAAARGEPFTEPSPDEDDNG